MYIKETTPQDDPADGKLSCSKARVFRQTTSSQKLSHCWQRHLFLIFKQICGLRPKPLPRTNRKLKLTPSGRNKYLFSVGALTDLRHDDGATLGKGNQS